MGALAYTAQTSQTSKKAYVTAQAIIVQPIKAIIRLLRAGVHKARIQVGM